MLKYVIFNLVSSFVLLALVIAYMMGKVSQTMAFNILWLIFVLWIGVLIAEKFEEYRKTKGLK